MQNTPAEQANGKNSPILPHQFMKLGEISVAMPEERPWCASNEAQNLKYPESFVDLCLMHTKGNNFPYLKLLSKPYLVCPAS
jgi:hypothetical protein